MTHREFIDAYRAGQLRVEIEPPAAARYLSARLLLPFVALPVLGCGVALALVGWLWTGLAVLAAGVAIPRLIRRSAPHFLLTQALETCFTPHKLNYELLGNQVPHLHWHLFPRYRHDSDALKPVWLALDRAERDNAERQRLETGPTGRAETINVLRQHVQKLVSGS